MAEAVNSITASTYSATTGLEFRYIGNWVYVYSGSYAVNTSVQTVLDTTSGSGIIVGELQFNGAVNDGAAPTTGQISTCTIKLNGLVVSLLKADTEDSYNGLTTVTQKLILPPFTRLECSVISSATTSERANTVTITGRVYGAD